MGRPIPPPRTTGLAANAFTALYDRLARRLSASPTLGTSALAESMPALTAEATPCEQHR